jgi:hypothetical protein
MNAIALTCEDDGKRSFLKWRKVLGLPSTLETVDFRDATIFTDPELVEDVLRQFDILEPRIELVSISHVRTISGNKDKYTVYLGMTTEDSYDGEFPDKPKGSTKSALAREDRRYPRYLFAMMWHAKNPDKDDLEYDLAYKEISEEYDEFINSRFDDPNEPLAECIVRFLNSKEKR